MPRTGRENEKVYCSQCTPFHSTDGKRCDRHGKLVCYHKAGVVWYSPGYEPDMHCKECGQDLG